MPNGIMGAAFLQSLRGGARDIARGYVEEQRRRQELGLKRRELKEVYGWEEGVPKLLGRVPRTAIVTEPPSEREERQIRTQKKKIAVNAIDKASSLMRMINQFDIKLGTLPVGKGIRGGFTGFWEETRARIPILKQAYPKATTTIDSLQAQRPQIARGMGDVGNMTEREQVSATKFVPHVSDADDTRLFKSLGGYALTRAKIIDAVELAGMAQDVQYKSRIVEIDREIEKRIKKLEDMGYKRDEVINFIGGELGEFDYATDPFGKFRKKSLIKRIKGYEEIE